MHKAALLTSWGFRVKLRQTTIQSNAHNCNGPYCAEKVDHGMRNVGLRVVQQSCIVQKLHQKGPKQEEPNQDPLCAQPPDSSLHWLLAWACEWQVFLSC